MCARARPVRLSAAIAGVAAAVATTITPDGPQGLLRQAPVLEPPERMVVAACSGGFPRALGGRRARDMDAKWAGGEAERWWCAGLAGDGAN